MASSSVSAAIRVSDTKRPPCMPKWPRASGNCEIIDRLVHAAGAPAIGVRSAFLTSARKAVNQSGIFDALGQCSTPPLTSTAYGRVSAKWPDLTLSGVSPPARISGLSDVRRIRLVQSKWWPVPPRKSGCHASSRDAGCLREGIAIVAVMMSCIRLHRQCLNPRSVKTSNKRHCLRRHETAAATAAATSSTARHLGLGGTHKEPHRRVTKGGSVTNDIGRL
jgi:hypothetical protein